MIRLKLPTGVLLLALAACSSNDGNQSANANTNAGNGQEDVAGNLSEAMEQAIGTMNLKQLAKMAE